MKNLRVIGICLSLATIFLLSGGVHDVEAQGRGRGSGAGKGQQQGGAPKNRDNRGDNDRGQANGRGDQTAPPIVVNPLPQPGKGPQGQNPGRSIGNGNGQNNGVRDHGRGVGNGNGQGKGQGWWRRELKGQNSELKSGNGQNGPVGPPVNQGPSRRPGTERLEDRDDLNDQGRVQQTPKYKKPKRQPNRR